MFMVLKHFGKLIVESLMSFILFLNDQGQQRYKLTQINCRDYWYMEERSHAETRNVYCSQMNE